jgi:methionine-gamma-lyase
MNADKKPGFATRQIHVGKTEDASGALCTPIYQTSTFKFSTVEQGGACFAGQNDGYIYTRLGNPSLTVVEAKLASLENGEAALAVASGMGAVATALWSSLSSGDEVIADDTLYGCTHALLNHGISRFGVKVTFVDFTYLSNLKEKLSPNTKVVYFETPCNPTLKILDIEEIARVAHEYNPDIRVIVDNTFCSPYLQRPLDLGADVVIHSATKYLNGHGDVIAGFIVGKSEFIKECRMFGLKDMTGAVLSPFDAFLIARGLKTLHIRMERHCQNARVLAEFFRNHPAVSKVYYPGFTSFDGHEVAKKQMDDFGGMIAIELNAAKEATAEAINNLKLCTIAVSLGDAETLVEHPATMTHSTYTPEDLVIAGISEGLVRISVGLEDVEDIIDDFRVVLDTLAK